MRYDIFISYRREGGFETAKHLNDLLVRDGYKVSFDIDTLRSGSFDTQLLARIEQCKDFILIVDAHAFDRTLDPNFNPESDWVRQELAHALKHNKNIVPIFLSGVSEFPKGLPEDINGVIKKNGPKYDRYFFDDFYKQLKSRFLRSRSRKKTILSALAVMPMALIIIYMLFVYEKPIIWQNPAFPHTTTSEELSLYAASSIKGAFSELGFEQKDSVKVVRRWEQEALEGDAKSQYYLGLCYYTGYVVDQNSKYAVKLFKNAVRQELAEAQYVLAVCYENGINVCRNSVKAIELWYDAANQGCSPAQCDYGVSCIFGEKLQPIEAAKWVAKSADQGYAYAQYVLAFFYANNVGVEFDIDETEYWLEKAAAQNCEIAEYNLASLYIMGPEYYRDIRTGVKILKESAKKEYPAALYDLAQCYGNGIGVKKDMDKALTLMEKSADKNFAPALTQLGYGYINPTGVKLEQDCEKGLDLLFQAAEQGYPQAQYWLGVAYMQGFEGVIKPNKWKARKWFKKAANQGVTKQTIQNQYNQVQQLAN